MRKEITISGGGIFASAISENREKQLEAERNEESVGREIEDVWG